MNRTLKSTMIIAVAVAVIGAIIAIIGISMGGIKTVTFGWGGVKVGEDTRGESFSQVYSGIKSMDIDVDLRDVVLVQGSEFKVECKDIGTDVKLVVTEEQGKLTVKDKWDKKFSFNIFGFTFNNDGDTDVTITYPAGNMDDIKISMDSGSLEISDLVVGNLKLHSDLGNIKMKNIEAKSIDASLDSGDLDMYATKTKDLKYDLDLGSLYAEGFTAVNINGKISSGNTKIVGSFTGTADMSGDLGSVDLMLSGTEDQYSYDLAADLGNVKLNSQKTDGTIIKEYGNKPKMKIRTDSGDITITTDN